MTTRLTGHAGRIGYVLERAREGPWEEGYAGVNVGYSDRALSGAIGLPMVAFGLKRKSLAGLAMAAVGGYLTYRAVTGHCGLYDAMELDSAHDAHAITEMHKG